MSADGKIGRCIAVSHELSVRHVRNAVQAGLAGVMVGRALWNEATGLRGHQRAALAAGVARQRMAEPVEIVERCGRQWHETLASRSPVAEAGWCRYA